MIAYIKGIVHHIDSASVIIVTAGIGYRVNIPTDLVDQLQLGQDIEVYTHHHVREDAVQLYGFGHLAQLNLFEQLISVSGIGPKAGIALLSQFSVEELQQSILSGDTSLLTKVSGIGKKTAERLILELKGSLAVLEDGSIGSGQPSVMGEAVSALEQLGYSGSEALAAIQQVDRSLSVEEQIKQALSQLGK